jgi:cation/acetate symporter
MVIPGGFSGAIWGAIAAGAIFVAAFALPLIVLALRGTALPFPIIGDEALWETATTQLRGWNVLGGAPGSLDFWTIAALAIGLAVLVPVVAPAFAAPDRRSARRAGIVSLLWLCLFAGLATATVAASSVALVQNVVGQKPDRLSPALHAASKNGVFLICGVERLAPIALRDVCLTRPGFKDALRESDLAPRRDFLFTNLPLLAGLGSAFSGLVAAALAALGLALASVGLHACATALGHDAFHRVRDAEALTSRRLAITRLLLIAAIVAATAWASTTAVDSRAAIALALVLSIAAVAPLIALILWPRASARDALWALLAGLAVAGLGTMLGGTAASAAYIAGASLVGGVLGFAVGIGSSVMRGGEREMGAAFVRTILRGKAEMPDLDRGA